MSERYCDKHQTTNHSYGSAYCEVWEAAMKAERARGDDGRAGAYAAGEHAERARIVAWLRNEELANRDDFHMHTKREDWIGATEARARADAFKQAANRIERGMHEEGAG